MAMRRHSSVLLVCCALVAYFGFHAVKGRHGLEARSALQARASVLGKELAALGAVRAGLEREVALLSERAPDPDFVEEIARELLALAGPRDRILIDSTTSAGR